MNRGTWVRDTARLHEHARSGVIRVAELERLGVQQRTAYRRCAPDGPWQWVLPGIVALDKAPLTRRRLLESALMHGGHDAMVTGAAACLLYGLREVPAGNQVHLLIPATCQIRSAGHALIERTIWYPKVSQLGGVPVAPLDRCVLDCVRRIRVFDPVRALLIEAVQTGKCSPGELLQELNTGSRRGTAVPRRVLTEIMSGTWSVAEAHAERILRRVGLPSPLRNVEVFDANGKFVAIPDLWWDDVALAWEIDSFAFHYNAASYAKTVRRNTRYAKAGIVVVQTLPTQVRDDPSTVADDLAAAFRTAASRPRPPVTFRPYAA